jgi:hypothetical protein
VWAAAIRCWWGRQSRKHTLCDAMQCVRSEVEWIVCFLCQADGSQEEKKKMSLGKKEMGEINIE